MKRAMSLVLLLTMLLCVFAGCGSKKDTGEATLYWALPAAKQSDADEVWAEVNKLLEEKLPETKLEFILDPAYESKWSLWMAGNTQIDLVNAGQIADFQTEISKDSYLPLNDLIDEYAPTIKKEMEKYEYQYATGMVNDELYAIPHIQMYINDTAVLTVPKTLYSYLDVKALVDEAHSNLYTTDKMYQIIDNYLKAATASGLTNSISAAKYIDIQAMYSIAKRGYNFIDANLAYKAMEDEIKIVNFYETDEFKTFVKWARKWFEAGYISKDVITGEKGIGARAALATANVWDMMTEDENHVVYNPGVTENYAAYQISLQSEEQKYLSHNTVGSLYTYTAIPYTSKHPERAMRLIELLHTEEGADILNTICFGIEGKHYEKKSETEIKAFEYEIQGSSANSYGIPSWEVSSHIGPMYVISPYTAEDKARAIKYYDEIQPNYYKTPVYGLSIDPEPVESEINQLKSVQTEYELQIISGATADWETKLAEASKKLDAAGIDKVIKEYQKQINDYVKANK